MAGNDLHSGHRMRMFKKYSKNGIDCLEDHEKLEILLFYVFPRVNTNNLAHILLNRFGSLNGVLNAQIFELESIDGIAEATALKLKYLGDFFKELNKEKPKRIVIKSSSDAAAYCRELFSFKVEEMVALLLDKSHTLIGRYDGEDNHLNSVALDSKKFSRMVASCECHYVILVHSHLDGVLLPSTDDCCNTRKVAEKLKALGAVLEDHVIIDEIDEFSFRDRGLVSDIWG